MWHMHNDGMFWGMHFFWWLFFILILIWLFIIPNNIVRRRSGKESPLDILKKRFAKGEISKEEYEERKHIIEQN